MSAFFDGGSTLSTIYLSSFYTHALAMLYLDPPASTVAAVYSALVAGSAIETPNVISNIGWPLGLAFLYIIQGPKWSTPTLVWVIAVGIAVWRTPRRHGRGGDDAAQGVEMENLEHITCSARMLDTDESQILTRGMMTAIWEKLPMRLKLRDWALTYCFDRDGAGLPQLFRKLRGLNRRSHVAGCLLLVKEESGSVCGAYASTPWEPQSGFFGTGESFVFSFPDPESDLKGGVYPWARTNDCFLTASAGEKSYIGVGGGDGGGYALWLEGSLRNGASSACKTFGSPPLASQGTFNVLQVEAWAFP